MVSLDDFVAETLIQIVRGAQRAQSSLGTAARISPPTIRNHRAFSQGASTNTKQVNPTIHSVDFDVQITASSGTETKGDAGVKLYVFSAGTGGQSSNQNEHVTRVRFSIPLVFDAEFPDADETDQ